MIQNYLISWTTFKYTTFRENLVHPVYSTSVLISRQVSLFGHGLSPKLD
uniref:Uncharacterized protein n=1 Tax=Anguilla anguilla TaxID=7936 RepID=A0A0E9RTE6_ANGAN